MKPRTQRAISWCGNILFVCGLVIVFLGMRQFPRLVNYQRIAIMLPLVWSLPLIYVDAFANWSTTSGYLRTKAVGGVIVAVILTVGCLGWFLVAPDAQATR